MIMAHTGGNIRQKSPQRSSLPVRNGISQVEGKKSPLRPNGMPTLPAKRVSETPMSRASANLSPRNGSSNAHHSTKNGSSSGAKVGVKPEPLILFQKFFKSVGPRTYAAQIKELANGNHLLVLTEGKRDSETQEVRKTRLFVYGEDFSALFRLLHETAAFIRANPLPEEVRRRRERIWAKKGRANSVRADKDQSPV